MSYKVFFAWQLDRHKNVCRWFIHRAAEDAIKAVLTGPELVDAPAVESAERNDRDPDALPEAELDWGAKGEGGTPQIAETILRKIRDETGIFLADVTPVSEMHTADGRKKQLPNPNVMLELGAALAWVGWDRVILVMNTAFGDPELLPFDLRHRSYPITYHLETPDDPEKAKKRKDLAKAIADNIRDIQKKGIITKVGQDADAARQAEEAEQAERAKQQRQAFEERLKAGKFYGIGGKRCVFGLSIIPAVPTAVPLTLGQGLLLRAGGDLQPMGAEVGSCIFKPSSRALGYVQLIPHHLRQHQHRPTYATEITDRGSIFAAKHWFWLSDHDNSEDVIGINMSHYEPEFTKAIYRYLRLLRTAGVNGPWHVGFSLFRAKNTKLTPSDQYHPPEPQEVFDGEEIVTDAVPIRADFDPDDEQAFMQMLRHPLDQFWRDYGWLFGARSFDTDTGKYVGFPRPRNW